MEIFYMKTGNPKMPWLAYDKAGHSASGITKDAAKNAYMALYRTKIKTPNYEDMNRWVH